MNIVALCPQLLLELGAKVKPEMHMRGDPTAPTGLYTYRVPLNCAAASHYVPFATLLLDHGADLRPDALEVRNTTTHGTHDT
jgi:hypothetical protein